MGQGVESCRLRLGRGVDSASLLTCEAAPGHREVEEGAHTGSHEPLLRGRPSYTPGAAASSGIQLLRLLEKAERVKL